MNPLLEKLPPLDDKTTQANPLTSFDPLQEALFPHLYLLQSIWWMAFFGTAAYLVATYILVPLCAKKH